MSMPAADHASPSADQTSHGRLSGVLRGAMWAAVESGPGVSSIGYRASAALNALLAAHPVDQGGRCRSCRRPRVLLGRRRRKCQIYWTARYWLNQPDEALSHLASARYLDARPPSTDKDHWDSTDALPAIEPDLGVPLQTPAAPPPLPPRRCPRAGRPDPDHGGTGVYSDNSPRSRRVPHRNPVTGPASLGRSLLLTRDLP